ncbi:833_t:CDS:2, partial [Racocetra fulgida]
SNEISELNDKETVICKLEKKRSKSRLSKVDENFKPIKQDDEKKNIKIEKPIKQEDDEKKNIKIEKPIKREDDEKKYIKIEKDIKQDDEKKDIKIEKVIKQEDEKKDVKVEEDLKTTNNIDYSTLTKQELLELHKKLIAINKKLEKQNIEYEKLFCQQEEKIKNLQKENQFDSIYSSLTTSENSKYTTHNTSTTPYLDGLKPDVSVTERNYKPTSSNVIIIGELKRVKLSKAHYEQVFNYGIKILG